MLLRSPGSHRPGMLCCTPVDVLPIEVANKQFYNSDDMMRMDNRADFFAGHFQGSIFKKHNKQLQRIWEILLIPVA